VLGSSLTNRAIKIRDGTEMELIVVLVGILAWPITVIIVGIIIKKELLKK